MRILICINNLILAEGLKRIIVENYVESIVENYYLTKKAFSPDIVLFDARDMADSLKKKFSSARFICIDHGLSESDLTCLLFCHGVHGIISPGLDIQMFCKALRTVYAGEIWVEQSHLKSLLNGRQALPNQTKIKEFSDQDRRIVELVACGKKNKEIADFLCLSEATVKAHLSRIYKTLNIQNRACLVALATESGWTVDNPV